MSSVGETTPEAPQWARVRGDAKVSMRRGAWYEVLALTPDEAVLDVHQQHLSVARSALQIVPTRPQRWSVVARPPDAVRLPLSWGSRYAVCPNCQDRAPLRGHPTELPCTRCTGVFAVAWDDPY
jgi:hypothetical protein